MERPQPARTRPLFVLAGLVVIAAILFLSWVYYAQVVAPEERLERYDQAMRQIADEAVLQVDAGKEPDPVPPNAVTPSHPGLADEPNKPQPAWQGYGGGGRCTEVGGYYRRNGTYVHGYTRCR